MASPGWTRGVATTTPISQQSATVQKAQASVVQHHYVRAQLHDINTRKGGDLLKETLAELKKTPQGQRATDAQIMEAINHMTKRLQAADLTINFMAPGWFMKPNTYKSYTQMYERAVRDIAAPAAPALKQMRLKGDKLNPAEVRAKQDNVATFRSDVMDHTSGVFKAAFGGLGRVMSPGALRAPTVDVKAGEFEASNPFFNPKSKQVFAALNYGRRPHGSTTTYGLSYMVLSRKFKTNAIYFAGDTFGATSQVFKVNGDHQVSFDLLGAVYAKGLAKLRKDLYASCILDGELPDVNKGDDVFLLLEAHLFEPLTFRGNIEAIYLSAKNGITTGSGADEVTTPLTGNDWQTIQTNARKFAAEHGAKLVFIE